MAKLRHHSLVLLGIILFTVMSLASTVPPANQTVHHLPEGFVYLWQFYETQIKPKQNKTSPLEPVREHLRYATEENFTGKVVRGYHPGHSRAVLTLKAAQALYRAQEAAQAAGYSLLIYDSYKPQKAVDSFVEWAKQADNCAKCRRNYFPYLQHKMDAFILPDRYVSPKSRHSGGSTVDLTIIKKGEKIQHPPTPIPRHLLNNQTVPYLFDSSLDMFTSFDLMHYASWPEGHGLLPTQSADSPYLKNRHTLAKIMTDAGFVQLPREWWHFTLKDEPFPESFFDFDF